MKAPASWHPPSVAETPASEAKRGRGRPAGTTGKHLPRSLVALAAYEQARAAGLGSTAALRAACAAAKRAFPGARMSSTEFKRVRKGFSEGFKLSEEADASDPNTWRVEPVALRVKATEPPAALASVAPGVKFGQWFAIGPGPRPQPAPRPKVPRLQFGKGDK